MGFELSTCGTKAWCSTTEQQWHFLILLPAWFATSIFLTNKSPSHETRVMSNVVTKRKWPNHSEQNQFLLKLWYWSTFDARHDRNLESWTDGSSYWDSTAMWWVNIWFQLGFTRCTQNDRWQRLSKIKNVLLCSIQKYIWVVQNATVFIESLQGAFETLVYSLPISHQAMKQGHSNLITSRKRPSHSDQNQFQLKVWYWSTFDARHDRNLYSRDGWFKLLL